MDDDATITWSHGEARVSRTAGMLVRAGFRDGDRWISPFASAPWTPDDPALADAPGHIRALGAKFVSYRISAKHDMNSQAAI